MDKIKIDYTQMPKYASENVGKTFLELVNKFFDNPENEAEYQNWRKENERCS